MNNERRTKSLDIRRPKEEDEEGQSYRDKRGTELVKDGGRTKQDLRIDSHEATNKRGFDGPNKMCTCKIKIQGAEAFVLIDTGSMVTIVRSSLIQDGRMPPTREDVEVVLKSASGHSIPVTREAIFQFEIGEQTTSHKAYLCPDLFYDAIIGFDFIQKHNIVIDAANETLWLNPADKIKLEQGTLRPVNGSMGLYLGYQETGPASKPPQTAQTPSRAGQERNGDAQPTIRSGDKKINREGRAGTDNATRGEKSGYQENDTGTKERQTNETPSPPIEQVNTIENHTRKVESDGAQGQNGPEQLDTGSLPPEQRKTLLNLIDTHSECFSWNGELGTCELIQHHIELTSNKPIRRPAYQVAQTQRAFIESEVRDMLQKGVIEPSVSPYAAGVVLVPKKTGELRFCVDYRGLNEVTKPDHYPLPVAHSEIFDTLGEATIFSCLDCQQGYWQVKVAPEDRPKTAFRCFLGLYQFRKLPFGLRTAPATYQRLMSHVLSGYIGKFCHCFIDDIICFSKTFEEHLEHLKLILSRLQTAGIKLKPSKCTFAKESVTYLGHLISVGELRPDSGNVEKIRDLPAPTTRREVRSFIGMAAYYRCFVKDFSRRAKPLTDLTKKQVTLHWGPEQESAFTDLKTALTSEPVLALPDFSRQFILMTDGSSTGLGAVLGQHFEGDPKERVIGYASRRTTAGEEKFSACELECLALVWATKHFRTYILGREIRVVTDHWALKWLLDLKSGNPRLQRWRMALQEYDMKITHKPGHQHRNADFLSRLYEGKQEASGAGQNASINATMRDQTSQEDAEGTREREEEAPSGTVPEAVMDAKQADAVSEEESEASEDGKSPRVNTIQAKGNVPVEQLRNPSSDHKQIPIQERVDAVQTRRKAKEAQEEERERKAQDEQNKSSAEDATRGSKGRHREEQQDHGPEASKPPSSAEKGDPAKEPTTIKEGRQHLRTEQEKDSDCREIGKAIDKGKPFPKWVKESKFRRANDGVLERVSRDVIGTESHQPVIPASMVKTTVQDAHAGHLKVAKTLAKLKEKYFFRNMYTQCSNHIESCGVCQEKDKGRKLVAPLGTMPKPWGAWHTIAVDVLGPLPQTRAGNKYVLVITDYLTRFVIALAIKDQTAETTAEAMMHKFLEYGFPARLITDNGPNFRAKLLEQLCSLLETTHLFTTPYHPQFDGLCERFNRTLTSMLRGFVSKHQVDWDTYLPYVMYAYRTSVQESTKETPFFLMFGRPSREPLDLHLRPEESAILPVSETKPAMVTRMHAAFDLVQAHLQEAHQKQKRYHDKSSRERDIRVGDEVLLLDERVPVGHTKKLHPPWKPGYRVIRKVGPLNFQLEHPNQRGKVLRVHINRIKLQKPQRTWPKETERESDGDLTKGRHDSPLDRWLQEERRRYRPFPDHWSSISETEDDYSEPPRLRERPESPEHMPQSPEANLSIHPTEGSHQPPNTSQGRDPSHWRESPRAELGRPRRTRPNRRTPERTRAGEVPIVRRSERIRNRKEQGRGE